MAYNKKAVRAVLDRARKARRSALNAPECTRICRAYGIPVPRDGLATSAAQAASMAGRMGFPVVMKIVSNNILHKTEAGGVIVGVKSAAQAHAAYGTILKNARRYKRNADITGIQVQKMMGGGQEVIVGAVTDPSFGKLVAFGLGGVLVEVMKDITFRLAPAGKRDAMSMINGIQAAEMLKGVRGGDPVDRAAIAAIIQNVSKLVSDFPEISELDLNPVFARKKGATAVDVRILIDNKPPKEVYRPTQKEILTAMKRIMMPKSVAVIGASAEDGKIGNSVMKNLINGGYAGDIYPVHPKADEILGQGGCGGVRHPRQVLCHGHG